MSKDLLHQMQGYRAAHKDPRAIVTSEEAAAAAAAPEVAPETPAPEEKPKATKTRAKAKPKTTEATPEKRKGGRPRKKTEPYKTINIAVPVSVLEQVEVAKWAYKGNLTEYVNAVIAEDLRRNLADYKRISEFISRKQVFKQ